MNNISVTAHLNRYYVFDEVCLWFRSFANLSKDCSKHAELSTSSGWTDVRYFVVEKYAQNSGVNVSGQHTTSAK